MNSLQIINLVAVVSLALALTYTVYRLYLQQRRLDEVKQRIELLNNHVSALSSGAVGVDRRVSFIERQMRDLAFQQESLVAQKQSDRPYGEAIQLVHQGADSHKLMDELGLSSSEAELVVMLHGVDKAS